MQSNQYKARLGKTLASYGISWAQHRDSPVHLMLVDSSFRKFMYQAKTFNDQFTWFNKPFTFATLSKQYPELYAFIKDENPQWLIQGNFFFFQINIT